MIKVIIVDDEEFIRERIKRCVNWSALGFELAGEAADGQDAISLVEEVKPGLAIVDINMPIVDGLKFASILKDKHVETKVIILTGYDKFEYAREALQTGVTDYLLKPVDGEEMAKVLEKLSRQIEKEVLFKKNYDKMQQQSKEMNGVQKQRFINNLLVGSSERDEKFENNAATFCPDLKDDELVVVLVQINKFPDEAENEKDLWKFAVLNIFEEIIGTYGRPTTSYCPNDRLAFICNLEHAKNFTELDRIEKLCSEAKVAVMKYLELTVSVGMGQIHQGFGEIKYSNREAMVAINNYIILGDNPVIRYDSLGSSLVKGLGNSMKNLTMSLRRGVSYEIDGILDYVCNTELAGKHITENLSFVITEFILTLSEFLYENNYLISDLTEEDLNPMSIIGRYKSIDEIKAWLRSFCNEAINLLKHGRVSSPRKMVDRAKEYIDTNYLRKDLRLQEISGSVYVNPCHLSSIYKKETGVSIGEYIKNCRMKKAKELIDEGSLSIYGVAEAVGFNDSLYFSKCFRKAFGLSPSKYIELKSI